MGAAFSRVSAFEGTGPSTPLWLLSLQDEAVASSLSVCPLFVGAWHPWLRGGPREKEHGLSSSSLSACPLPLWNSLRYSLTSRKLTACIASDLSPSRHAGCSGEARGKVMVHQVCLEQPLNLSFVSHMSVLAFLDQLLLLNVSFHFTLKIRAIHLQKATNYAAVDSFSITQMSQHSTISNYYPSTAACLQIKVKLKSSK